MTKKKSKRKTNKKRESTKEPVALKANSRRTAKGILSLMALVSVTVLASYWYVHQPEKRQKDIQETTARYLDKGAKSVGNSVSDLVERIRDYSKSKKSDRDKKKPEAHRKREDSDKPGFFSGFKEKITSIGGNGRYGQKYYYAGQPRTASGFSGAIRILKKNGFAVGYCEERKNPAWVCYKVFMSERRDTPERPSRFDTDDRTRARVTHDDYTGSGYDRGHMAPNYAIAICYGEEGQHDTFQMSNIIPQTPNLNRRVWKHLEQEVAKDYVEKYGEIWVITGPIYDDAIEMLDSGVQIPDACYKILIDEDDDELRVLAFIMGQDVSGRESLNSFLVSVDEIEDWTGLDFLSDLPDELEDEIERRAERRIW